MPLKCVLSDKDISAAKRQRKRVNLEEKLDVIRRMDGELSVDVARFLSLPPTTAVPSMRMLT